MNNTRIQIRCCYECKPVFNKDGTQDMYYRHEACHSKCERYIEQATEIHELKHANDHTEHADYLRSRKKYKGQF